VKEKKSAQDTSWGKVADWYGSYLEKGNSYHTEVVLPHLTRVLSLTKGEHVLDLACGQGFFSRAFAKTGAHVVGADIAEELIEAARKQGGDVTYHVAPASQLSFAKDGEFSTVVCVLALQNIEDLAAVCREVKRVLQKGGRFVMVCNHPAFRVLKRSSWQFDEEKNIQYRRVDGYLSGAKVEVDMHPGKHTKIETISYHRSLQDFFKALTAQSFAVTKLEEWISHRESGKGPRQQAEDTARKEIPLFMMLEARAHIV